MATLIPPGYLAEKVRALLNSILANTPRLNAANTYTAQQNFGGVTSAYPSLNNNGAVLEAKLADGSGYAGMTVGALTSESTVNTQAMTVAGLPAAATAGAGARAFVTDATSATFGAAVVGSGANKVPVWSNGAGWFVG